MITLERMMSIDKNNLQEASKAIPAAYIPQLIEWLSLKDNACRYQAFLLLQNRSVFFDDVYPHWDIFQDKLHSANSYQRSIGLMLLAENVRWDAAQKINGAIEAYLALLHDEKPITIRQCIQSLEKILPYAPQLNEKIAGKLISFDLTSVAETMRKSILLDILHTLCILRKGLKSDAVETYILTALSGEVLDKQAKKRIEALLC